MRILVDTSIWSLALRRKGIFNDKAVAQLRELITESRVEMIGPIRQEILSGISDAVHFEKLRQYLAAFEDYPISRQDYENAAEMYTLCRKRGIQGSNTDFLICAVAVNNKMSIFTTDKDFTLFAKVLPIRLA
ncbi:MAG: PilT protein domain protein [Gammaproteobacteria bacterium]|jgi:predicted nucleic acid-binding protein|nr:PilT protein domain protein [Gammaproteobacteria bacterium]MCE3237802.1 PilT protein domain protein [Gammaproteobacteria bacterium]